MWSRRRAGMLAVTLLSTACTPPQPPAPTFSPADEAAIRAEFDTTLAAFKSRKYDGWNALWAGDAILYPPNVSAVAGSAARLAWASAFPEIEELSFPNVKVVGEGNVAWATTDYVLKVKGAPVDSGRQLVTLHREANGKWIVTRGMFNSSLPIPTPPAGKGKK